MTLPPYEPDGSLPPIPVEDVTAKDLIARYEVSKQTIYTRLSSIGVTGTKRGKQVFFSPVEVHQLDAAHHWLGKGYGLQDLKQAALEGPGDQVVDVGVPMEEITPAHQQMELTIAPQQERVVMALTTAVQQALQASTPAPPKDPLAPYRMLQEASDKKFQLTSQSVREILGLSQSTSQRVPHRVGPGRWGLPGGGRPRPSPRTGGSAGLIMCREGFILIRSLQN